MKNYTITVNGTAYDVTVEEGTGVAAPVAPAAPKAAPAAPKAAPAAPKATAPAGAAGSIKVEAGAAGKVFKIDKQVGESVKRGEGVVTIEAMKMEIPVVAPEDGVVASINVSVGDSVDAGALLATLK
jgi:glutaconyl-CoA/methylmalonyl-CoA decarboxylase subunit gamma